MNPEIINISNLDYDSKSTPANGGLRSANFGGGIELLMNDKIKDGGSKLSSDIHLDDLTNLENELNDLTDNTDAFNVRPKSDFFGGDPKQSVRFDDLGGGSGGSGGGGFSFGDNINLGQATSQTEGGADDAKTWDGYGKFNNIPINPDQQMPTSSQPQMSKEDLLREKFKYLRKLEALEKKGVELSKKYNMESSLLEMQGEYETIMDEKAKQNSIKFQGNMMMAVVNGLEFLNGRFDPFDVKLDGWGEQINENINDYDDVFAELYEKYKSKASMAPELKLLFQLGGSAMMVHMTNTMFKSAMPSMDDIMRQNPDLMRQFQSAAVNSMGQSNPGFAGFMGGFMNDNGMGPPPPMATQGPNAMPPTRDRPGNNNASYNRNDGINFRESSPPERSDRRQAPPPTPTPNPNSRPEMKGPSDISDILSGLKTKTINIQESTQQQQQQQQQSSTAFMNDMNESSTISISDLKDLQNDGNMPKKSKRRQRSDKNTISLDI